MVLMWETLVLEGMKMGIQEHLVLLTLLVALVETAAAMMVQAGQEV